jgi:hypothetical protein
VLSIIFKSSTAYNNENDGTAINNKTKHGINVQTISKTVLCCTVVGKVSKLNTVVFCSFEKFNCSPLKTELSSLTFKEPTTNSKIKKATKITIQIRKKLIS